MYIELTTPVKEQAAKLGFKNLFLLGLTNDGIGYLIPEHSFNEHVYEATFSLFGPKEGEYVQSRMEWLLGMLSDGGADVGSAGGTGAAKASVSPDETNPALSPIAPKASVFANVNWDDAKKSFEYDRDKPLNIQIKDKKDFPGFTKISFTYDSAYDGGRVPAVLMIPKEHVKPMKADRATIPGAFPAMFFMHFHVADKSLADIFSTWPGSGIAVMAIDGVFRGEREEKGKDVLMPDPRMSAKHIRMQVLDILRGLDVLSAWQGIDAGRIGFMGISMGAVTGTDATALDSRVKSIILADGAADFSLIFENSEYGDVQETKQFMKETKLTKEELIDSFKFVDPSVFAPHLGDRPVLLMNGKTDTTMTMPAMLLFHNLVQSPQKKIIWYDSGHVLPFDKVVGDALKWFKQTL
jgi:cephalosporin-C deacetylase-like acetyl esterase